MRPGDICTHLFEPHTANGCGIVGDIIRTDGGYRAGVSLTGAHTIRVEFDHDGLPVVPGASAGYGLVRKEQEDELG